MKSAKTPLALTAALLLPIAPAGADVGIDSDDWQFGARVYAWLPDVEGTVRFPIPGSPGQSISASASDILDKLEFTFMGSLMARKGRLSFLTDVIYLDLGDSNRTTLDTPGPGPGIKTEVKMSMESWIWNLAAAYTVAYTDNFNLDFLAGVRMLDMDNELRLQASPELLPITRSQTLRAGETLWDGVVGLKGRFELSDAVFIPYYADVGTGDSDLTWQAMIGLGYNFSWGAATLTYRHLEYDQGSGKMIEDLSFGGPALGLNFRF